MNLLEKMIGDQLIVEIKHELFMDLGSGDFKVRHK